MTGRFQLHVTPEDADIVYVSEDGPPDPESADRLDGRVYETAASAVWFLAVDSKGQAKTGEPYEWRAPIRVKPDVRRVSGGYKVSLSAMPRAAVIRATFDGSDPKKGPSVTGEIDAPSDAKQLRVIAEIAGQFGQEETAPLTNGGVGERPTQAPLNTDAPATMTSRFEPKDTASAFSALDRLAKIQDTKVLGGTVDLNGGRSESDFLTLRLGRDLPLCANALDRLVKELATLLAAESPTLKLRLDGVLFPSGRDLMRFCDECGEDFDRVTWKQD